MTRTSTTTFTRTHTATYLADVILGSVADILATLGIDRPRSFDDWENDQRAISNWIKEESLECVVLECHQPNGTVDPVLEFPVAYEGTGEGDRKFIADRASLARYLPKLQKVPAGTKHRLICTFNGNRTPQPGWGPASRASVVGLQSHSFGRLAAGPHATAELRYLRR